ncbi:major facilitator superfamily MFS_1 [Catenulispora acidiphila DSM 44928]|uniref:Major facilitator superfamily MFS_1 n=1 Tax=Catenulispora acidiphila (strain DSM 44928 / JCM 14897 / NBRC 102108 / NRRL B-24433 / ID139908) TaxID=479433 RepID=C7PZU8_CATAD|nr:MFS transporter [Catenulispora acidiphila]ACU73613.1 major facilitator superfamily MFS_1 [Catenulispora acidiphila DSM 44928]
MNGSVLRWVCAYTCSVSGDSVYFVTLSWAASRSLGPVAAGVVLAVGAVPRALLMLGGGVVADRFGPWRVLIGSDLVRCVLVVGAALAVADRVQLGVLVALAVGFGTVDALFMPAVGALPPVLVAPDELARVQGMRVLGVRAANLAGPVLAGVMLGVGGASGSFLGAAALFGASLVLLMTLRIPRTAVAPEAGLSLWEQFGEGLRYVRQHTELRRLVIVIGLSEMCFSGPIAVAVVLLVAERHWSSTTAGWILGAFSVGGAAVAGIMATTFAHRASDSGSVSDTGSASRARLTLTASLALTAALLLAWTTLGRAGAIAISACLGATTGVTTVVANARLQTAAAPQFLGRVTSVTTLCTLGLSPLLFPLVGVAAEAWGTGAFFALCAVVCAAAAVVSSRSTPSGRLTAARADALPTPARPRTPPRSPRR